MAGSIQLFRCVQKYYRTLGIYPDSQSNLFNFRNLFAIFCFLLYCTSTLAFFLFKASTILEYGVTFYLVLAELCILYILFVQMWQMPNILKLITNFEEFIEKREHAKIAYRELNEKIEKMCGLIYFVLVNGTFVGFLLPAVLRTAVNYFIHGLKTESYFLPAPAMLPFDWQTPLGYSIAITVEALAVFYTTLCDVSIITFFVGPIWVFKSFMKDIASELSYFDDDETSNERQKLSIERFCNIVQLYSDVKQYFGEFNAINEFSILGYFTFSVICISSALLVIQAQISEHALDPMELFIPLIELVWTFVMIAFYCEFSQKICEEFERFSEQLQQCNWYLFPIEIQRMYLIFLLDAQQLTVVRGYGNIFCTRDTFKKTTSTGFSYFMALCSINAKA